MQVKQQPTLILPFLPNYTICFSNPLSSSSISPTSSNTSSPICSSLSIPSVSVYPCYDNRTGQQLAIKIIKKSSIDNEVKRYLLQCETDALKKIQSPFVIKCIENGESADFYYFIMEKGMESLKDRIAKGQLKRQQRLQIFYQIVCGYMDVHQHMFLHRDIKPSNILLFPNFSVSSPPIPKLVDFGFSQPLSNQIAKPTILYNVGSPSYMSPQAHNRHRFSQKSDIWSLGICLFEMITRRTPDYGISEKEYFDRIERDRKLRINYQRDGIKGIQREILQSVLEVQVQKRVTIGRLKYMLDKARIGKVTEQLKQKYIKNMKNTIIVPPKVTFNITASLPLNSFQPESFNQQLISLPVPQLKTALTLTTNSNSNSNQNLNLNVKSNKQSPVTSLIFSNQVKQNKNEQLYQSKIIANKYNQQKTDQNKDNEYLKNVGKDIQLSPKDRLKSIQLIKIKNQLNIIKLQLQEKLNGNYYQSSHKKQLGSQRQTQKSQQKFNQQSPRYQNEKIDQSTKSVIFQLTKQAKPIISHSSNCNAQVHNNFLLSESFFPSPSPTSSPFASQFVYQLPPESKIQYKQYSWMYVPQSSSSSSSKIYSQSPNPKLHTTKNNFSSTFFQSVYSCNFVTSENKNKESNFNKASLKKCPIQNNFQTSFGIQQTRKSKTPTPYSSSYYNQSDVGLNEHSYNYDNFNPMKKHSHKKQPFKNLSTKLPKNQIMYATQINQITQKQNAYDGKQNLQSQLDKLKKQISLQKFLSSISSLSSIKRSVIPEKSHQQKYTFTSCQNTITPSHPYETSYSSSATIAFSLPLDPNPSLPCVSASYESNKSMTQSFVEVFDQQKFADVQKQRQKQVTFAKLHRNRYFGAT